MTTEEGIKQTVEIREIPIGLLKPNPYQPETRLEPLEEVVQRYADSIAEVGLQVMPVVRPKGIFYEVGDGWLRRCALLRLYGESAVVTCIVKELTDRQMADMAIEANQMRTDLNGIELGEMYSRYCQEFGITQAELAKRFKKSQSEIANTIRLLELPYGVRLKIISREITSSHGRALLRVRDPKMISELAAGLAREGTSVRALEEIIDDYIRSINPAMEIPEAAESGAGESKEASDESNQPSDESKEAETGPEAWREDSICQTCVNACPDKRNRPHGSKQTEEGKVYECPSHSFPQEGKSPAEARAEKTEEVTEEQTEASGGLPLLGEDKTPETATGDQAQSSRDINQDKPAEKKAEPKPAASKPAATPAPAAAKPAWARKMVLEEKGDRVLVSVMSEGKFPVMRNIEGSLESIINGPTTDEVDLDNQLLKLLEDATASWQEK